MLKKLSFIYLLKAVITAVQNGTGLRCYDYVIKGTKSPFYFAEIVGLKPDNTKTMFIDVFTVYIHAIAEESPSSIGVYNMIQALEESFTKDITLPEGFTMFLQSSQGLKRILTDETGEKHAIMAYEFKVCYGLKIK